MAKKSKRKSRNHQSSTARRQRAYQQNRQAERLLPRSAFNWTLDKGPQRDRSAAVRKNQFIKNKEISRDRRLWRPDNQKRSLKYGRQDASVALTLKNRTRTGKPYQHEPRQGFVHAKRVEVCKRRADRRELLFRRGKAGKGRRITSPKTLNIWSKVRCK